MARHPSRRQFTLALASGPVAGWSSFAQAQSAPSATAWSATEEAARGQTVYFNAWGGSARINDYLKWAATEAARLYGITVEHVKVTDTADVVKRVRTEKSAGKLQGGSVDMAWINGENFLAMKREGLLFGPFAESLPSYALVDTTGKPTTRIDFSEPVNGMEAPWGMAQLTFYADSSRLPKPPTSMAALLDYARANPGRISYPRPPDFMGTTFVKQAWLELSADKAALYKPYSADNFAATTDKLWRFLDELHPQLWRQGKQFPTNAATVRQMMNDGELHLGLTFNPNEAANEIAANRMSRNVRSYQFDTGTLGNTHFLAIPFNANAHAGAQVFINFLLSPAAQARKADIKVWGDPTVLALDKLPAAERATLTQSRQPGQVEVPRQTLPEPHGSWVDPLEKEWLRRYGR
jgi:putative thiamine transport system substrate-binding protein